jgi:hypothetical protein
MRQAARISPVNSLVFIHGGRGDVTPLPIWGAQILATNSCVSVVCYPEVDGPTDIVFGDVSEVGLDRPPDFEGILRTPDRKVVIATVDDQTVLNMPVAAKLTAVKIWRSHPRWPEVVRIGTETPANIDTVKRAMLPTEHATRTSIPLPEGISSIFLCDGGIPRAQRDFNPWLYPEFLRSGISLQVGNPVELTVATGRLGHLPQLPDVDAILGTPSKEVWIFDSRQKVLLKIDGQRERTRVCVWSERVAATQNVTILLSDVKV